MDSASPGYDFFLLIILSCTIATFGLLSDSTAVIIGAMLVAPLMSPILGLSLSSVAGEQFMFRRSIIALVEGVFLAIALSALITAFSYQLPYELLNTLPNEVLSRTQSTPFDLIIGPGRRRSSSLCACAAQNLRRAALVLPSPQH